MPNETPDPLKPRPTQNDEARIGLPAALGIAGIVFACFSPSLDNFFAGDDFSWFFHTLKTIYNPETFLAPVNHFYRLTESLYFLATILVFGRSPLPFFLVLVVIHTLNAILVSSLIARVSGNRLAGIVGGLAWALWYKHAEVVLRPYAVADSAALLFGVCSLLLVLRGRILISSLLLIPALFAKENAVLFPLLATILVVFSDHDKSESRFPQIARRWGRATVLTSPLWGLAGAFALLEILGSQSDRYLSPGLGVVSRFWENWVTYLGPDATWIREVVLGGAPTLVPIWLAFGLFVPFGLLLRRLPGLVRLGVAWTCITMLPTLAIPFQSSRYHYVPLVGVGLIFGVVWSGVYARVHGSPKGRRTGPRGFAPGIILLISATVLLAGYFIVGIQNEERDTAQIGELHRRAAASFEAEIVPFLDRDPNAMTVFLRSKNLDIAHSLFRPRPWFMPETYKWVYRRPHGILGLADTYGFVSYCTYDPERPTLFVTVPRKEYQERLASGSFSVVLHVSTANVFSLGGQEVRDKVRKLATIQDSYSFFQPGCFDPTFDGIDQLSPAGP